MRFFCQPPAVYERQTYENVVPGGLLLVPVFPSILIHSPVMCVWHASNTVAAKAGQPKTNGELASLTHTTALGWPRAVHVEKKHTHTHTHTTQNYAENYLEVEHGQQRLRDDVVEPHEERRELVPHAHQQAVLENQLDVLPDILVRHVQLGPALLELDRLHRAQPVLRESEVQTAHLSGANE